jgi:flagellar biosynthesis/type III secretory pathway protein FliH
VRWNLLLRKANPSNIVEIEGIKDFLEADSMLAERIESWFDEATRKGVQQGMQKGMQQGMQKGMQQGMQVGLLKGQAGVLAKLLKLRFGPLPEEVIERLSGAMVDELDGWVEAVLTAPTLSAVFDPSRH